MGFLPTIRHPQKRFDLTYEGLKYNKTKEWKHDPKVLILPMRD